MVNLTKKQFISYAKKQVIEHHIVETDPTYFDGLIDDMEEDIEGETAMDLFIKVIEAANWSCTFDKIEGE